ncbi:relaxase/mobilization nuclease domain-containing protein [Ralstonia pseudosolanacearum]|uniref:relaxase/mobilization nuclease domain-containing protein n=1 Tax=Ralstonia pseudosolanacearum TaxID=1310165 RepID=UPI001FF703CE|nr:relaxase/mobilization nuclease domain-containing protein [Ralstonia pseudosolanacearum]
MVPIIPLQRQHKPNASKRFNDLIEYLEGEQEKAKPAQEAGLQQDGEAEASPRAAGAREAHPNEFGEILSYATAPVDTKVAGEKCIALRTHGVIGIQTASAEMNAVARKNTRCQDPVYHFILSWPEHEKPAPEAIFDAAEHAIKSLGFEEHQYVIAIHANTDNIHAHVAMNRVHPTTYKSRHIEWAKRTLHFAARESEIKHGWTHDNGIYVVEVDGQGKKHIVLNTKHAGAKEQGEHAHPEIERDETLPTWHDPESLDSYLKTSVAKALKQDLPDLTSWQALHVWLEQYDITLKDTGGGGLRLRAVSQETGEILETPVSKGLRLLKRPELEKRWGPFKPPFTNPVIVPDLTNLTPTQIDKGVDHVIRIAPDRGIPPPDHVLGIETGTPGTLPEGGSGLHAVPGGALATGGQVPSVLLPGALQDGLGDDEAGQDPGVRRAAAGRAGGSGGGSEGRVVESASPASGRKPRDPALRAQRKAERAAARADLRKRYTRYRNFVADGDTDYFARLKALQVERSRQVKALQAEAKAAKAAIPKVLSREVRLVSIIEIDAEVTRRKLIAEAQYHERREALRIARVPPLQWREWLYEQANRGDKAALSALRGIVYQAQRDAKLPKDGEKDDELEDLEVSAADYQEQQHKRLMARLLAEERKERAIRSNSVHAMRPHEVDALILAYAGIQWRVTGNGNVEYSRNDGQHLFTDRGNRVTFDRMRVTDEEIKLALIHSREKFGRQITLTGEEPIFVARMARLADDMGLKVLNPELLPVVQAHREAKKQVAGQLAKDSAQQTLQTSAQAPADAKVLPAPAAAPEAAQTLSEATGQGDAPAGDLERVVADHMANIQPTEPAMPAAGEERLRALVLGIDPRATFEIADPADERRLYVGPVASTIDDALPMFAQHLGRSHYVIHRQAAPADHNDRVIEVRYRAGQVAVSLPQQDKGQGL